MQPVPQYTVILALSSRAIWLPFQVLTQVAKPPTCRLLKRGSLFAVRAHGDFQFAEHRARPADDHVAWLDRAHALGRSGIDQVAGIKRVERRGELDQPPA